MSRRSWRGPVPQHMALLALAIAVYSFGTWEASPVPADLPPSGPRDGLTLPALHRAAENGDTTMVRKLLANGADVQAPASEGMTALHVAAASGSAEVARVLLGAGALAHALDSAGMAPVHEEDV